MPGLFDEAPFGPQVVPVMADALERACQSLDDTGQPEIVKEVLAKRIIAAAHKGIRDPRELCAEALKSLGIESDCSTEEGLRHKPRPSPPTG